MLISVIKNGPKISSPKPDSDIAYLFRHCHHQCTVKTPCNGAPDRSMIDQHNFRAIAHIPAECEPMIVRRHLVLY